MADLLQECIDSLAATNPSVRRTVDSVWTIQDGSHIPFFSIEFADMATDWLFRHSR